MKLPDLAMLTMAKLRVRKRRTIISALTISLLFGIIIAALVVSNSFMKSINVLSGELFDGNTYIAVAKNIPSYDNANVFAKAKELYDASDETQKEFPIITQDDTGGSTSPYLDTGNEFARQAISEFREQQKKSAHQFIDKLAGDYGGTVVSEVGELTPKNNAIVTISAFESTVQENSTSDSSIAILSNDVLGDVVMHQPQANVVPVVIYASHAEKVLGLKLLPNDATASERHDRLNYIHQHAPGVIFEGELSNQANEEQKTVRYQIVGTVPDNEQLRTGAKDKANLVDIALSSLSNGSYYGMIIPGDFISETVLDYYEYTQVPLFDNVNFMVKFNDAKSASSFMRDNSCHYIANSCDDFFASEFITSSATIYHLTETARKLIGVIALFFCIVAVCIMTGMLGRIIEEEKQATAIYRAIGASKLDIRKIYIAYVGVLCIMTASFALLIGYGTATILHILYAKNIETGVQNLYGVTELDHDVWLIGLDVYALGVVVVIFAAGILSMLLSIDKLTSKSIINDIKD